MANLSNIKKGDKVILRLFTGAFVGAKEIEKTDKTTISFVNNKGIEMKFSKKTGKQIEPEPKSERFANFIEEYDAKVEKEEAEKKKTKKKSSKKPTKRKTEDNLGDDDDYEQIEE